MSAPTPPAADADFAALVSDVAHAIEHTMPGWRVRLGEGAARWRAEGVCTAVLERALALPSDPGADALRGVNVFETMRAACSAVLRRLTAAPAA